MRTLTIETGGPARVTVISEEGRAFAPSAPGTVRDRTAAEHPGALDMDRDPSDGSRVEQGYTAHFLSDGEAEVPVPQGTRCSVTVERGPEHRRIERSVEIGDHGARVVAVPERWADQAAEGWWSGDLHVHRPLEDAAAILRAEDLHLGAFVTRWTGQERAEHVAGPPEASATVDGHRHAVAPVTEDERGGGAWLLHGAAVGDLPHTDRWWYPAGRGLVDAACAAGAFFDCEKLTWWETPVMMATGAPDSVGVLNNHYVPGGFVANEAWGRPRDRAAYPGAAGTSRYQLELYYRYLSCGLRLPASAGSASGVLPAPPGHNRVYVDGASSGGGACTVPEFYAALRAGRSMVTNGPLLRLTVGDAAPGATVPGVRTRVRATARSQGPVSGVEIVVDGRVAARSEGGDLDVTLDLAGTGWLVARAFAPDARTIRLAHTSPVYVDGPGSPDAAEHRAYFARWIEDLTARAQAEPSRFPGAAARAEVLDLYARAARWYTTA